MKKSLSLAAVAEPRNSATRADADLSRWPAHRGRPLHLALALLVFVAVVLVAR